MDQSSCCSDLSDVCELYANQLFEIWQRIGYPQRKIEENVNGVVISVTELLKGMVSEEKDNRTKLLSYIEKMLEEGSVLCKEVGVDYQLLIEGLEEESVPLIHVADILKERVQELRNKKEKLLGEYSELLNTEDQLCNYIGLHKQPKITGVPHQKALDKLSMYLQQKIEEKYVDLKQKIEVIQNELAVELDVSFHKHLMPGRTHITLENMTFLQSLYESLIHRQEMAMEESVELREKLANLWDRLQVSYEERNAFLAQHPGHSTTVIDALKSEVICREDQKRQNIPVVVGTIRREIEDWWDKCCFGEQQRRRFHSFFSDCYTKDLLDLHELEVKRLRMYFENNRHILDSTQKWKEVWEKKIEFDKITASDPKRLFGNRRAQLLYEENERKTLQKQLSCIEENLIKSINKYERKQNSSFLYDGVKLKDLINNKWKEWQNQKETEKKARMKLRGILRDRNTCMNQSIFTSKLQIVPSNSLVSGPSKESRLNQTANHSHVVREIFTRKGNTPAAPWKNAKSPQKPRIPLKSFVRI